jgi:predicted phosphodiesterase
MRVLVISDIHANLLALETVLSAAAGQHDAIWCLGDIVGYGPRPNECVDLIRTQAAVSVIGNHDWAALDRPGVNIDDFNPYARQAVIWTQEQLTSASRAYLDSLPDKPVRPRADLGLLATHASPREPVWEYILTPTIALENFALFDEQICLVGHTHKPVIFAWQMQEDFPLEEQNAVPQAAALDVPGAPGAAQATAQPAHSAQPAQPATPRAVVNVSYLQPQAGLTLRLGVSERLRLIVNPGSVGQPRDNDARAAYAILDLERMTWRYERVPYPVELTQNQMRAANLPRRLIDRLSFGW